MGTSLASNLVYRPCYLVEAKMRLPASKMMTVKVAVAVADDSDVDGERAAAAAADAK